jgi:hypothetical protein
VGVADIAISQRSGVFTAESEDGKSADGRNDKTKMI